MKVEQYDMLQTVIIAAEQAPDGTLVLARVTDGQTDALITVLTGEYAHAARQDLFPDTPVFELATEDADSAGGDN